MECFEIYEVRPCADYQGVTLEGKIFDNTIFTNKLTLYLEEYIKKKIILDGGKIKIYYHENFTLYLYDNGKFIMSRLNDEKVGLEFLKGILKGE